MPRSSEQAKFRKKTKSKVVGADGKGIRTGTGSFVRGTNDTTVSAPPKNPRVVTEKTSPSTGTKKAPKSTPQKTTGTPSTRLDRKGSTPTRSTPKSPVPRVVTVAPTAPKAPSSVFNKPKQSTSVDSRPKSNNKTSVGRMGRASLPKSQTSFNTPKSGGSGVSLGQVFKGSGRTVPSHGVLKPKNKKTKKRMR